MLTCQRSCVSDAECQECVKGILLGRLALRLWPWFCEKQPRHAAVQALAPEALAPLTLVNPVLGKALLCGDPK